MSRMLLSSLSPTSMERVNTSETDESSVPASRILQTVSAALLVGISYYVGTRIGFAWTPSGQPNSTFWPPNAILLAALLLAPRRAWWTFLLAVLPAHMFAQLQTGVPMWTAIGWFITNSIEALIGAYCITKFTDSAKRVEGVRWVLVFVVFGVLFAPLATSFLDAAAVVITGWGRDYWHLGMERFWTNALAELTIVPTVVLCSSKGISWIRRISVARGGEAALLAVGTVLVAVVVFGLPTFTPATTPALLYLPLPFLLWAAARFGLAGLSLSLLSLALTSTWYTMHGREPFPYASLPQNILSLQILFCVVAVPLMFLSAVMAETRRTQESLRRVSGSLIDAQEQERARISRELHDDIGQRLALLAFQLQQLHEDALSLPEVRSRMGELLKQISEIANDIQSLSHELDSAKLQYLGIARAMGGFCREFAEQQKVEIDFKAHDLPSPMSPDISLCLFRVLQEALHNSAKHSGVRHFEVRLWGTSDEIHLTVKDSGAGFDRGAAIESRGLGLISMEERLKLVKGTFSINSQPKRGTTIDARVPLNSGSESMRAAGA
jgi:signal transduction histidine kinase